MASTLDPAGLDLGYLALFVGQRINELILERAAAEGFGDLRVSHGYVVQHVIGGPRTITELASLLGVTQQAASKTVAEMVELGYLEVSQASDRRARVVALSARGQASLALARKQRAKIEHKLVSKYGARLGHARALLAEILEDLGGAPAVRARQVREPR